MKQIFHRQSHSFFLRLLIVLLVGAAVLHASATHAATDETARVVKYSKEDIVPVHAKLRFSTLIILPEDEEILDFTTGDKEFWVINGAHNLCYVHPAQAGIRSNLNLITASGHVYSFLLTEISNQPNAAMSVLAKPRRTRRNSKASAPRPQSRYTLRRPSPPTRSTISAQPTQRNSSSTISSIRKRAASHSWFPPSTTTTHSPISSVARGKTRSL